jgi:hypothetical protein
MSAHTEKSAAVKDEASARREFLGSIGKAAITAPAVALLLTASTRKASAQYAPEPNEE